jgi:hypothetical protein
LIALIGWQEPGYYQCMGTIGRGNLAALYANLWHTQNKRMQKDNNVTFYVYFDSIRYIIKHTPCITAEILDTYKDIAWLKAEMHHMYVQEKDLAC